MVDAYCAFYQSPNLNSNLLRRSEVVALINTLHRFSESLEAVNHFRHLWAEMDHLESAKLIKEAEKSAAVSVHSSITNISVLTQRNFLQPNLEPSDDQSAGLLLWLGKFKERADVGISAAIEAWHRGLRAITSLFKPSEQLNSTVYGEL